MRPLKSTVCDLDIVADANLALLPQTFAQHGRITSIPGRDIRAEHVRKADVLLLRSVTQADAELLAGSQVRFIATATIGTDHLDISYLAERDIAWASAPGCNADAAAQYTLAMACLACQRLGRKLEDQSVGIIGLGNVGSRLQHLLSVLGIASVACDPPLAKAGVSGLVSLEEALAQPLVSLHVPLSADGPHPTLHMLDRDTLAAMRDGSLLVNTARGQVVDGNALINELHNGRLYAALDVWPDEPNIDPGLVTASLVATPHVAGYSLEGKRNGSLMIYAAFRNWLGLSPQTVGAMGQNGPVYILDNSRNAVSQLLEVCGGVQIDDDSMRAMLRRSSPPAATEFDRLRQSYRLRRDFSAWTVSGASVQLRPQLAALGFNLSLEEERQGIAPSTQIR